MTPEQIMEACAEVADKSAAVHRGAMEAESVIGKTIRLIRIEEAQWIAAAIRRLASAHESKIKRAALKLVKP